MDTTLRVRVGQARNPSSWFTRSLLYWDEVGTIVPSGPEDEVKRILGEHTLRLMEVGLVSSVYPALAQEAPRFDEAFIDLMEADRASGRRVSPEAPRKTFQVHWTKPGYQITAYLKENGLMEASSRGPGWMDVEERTADVFMAYLACTLAATDMLDMSPITDRAQSLAVLASSPPGTEAPELAVNELQMSDGLRAQMRCQGTYPVDGALALAGAHRGRALR